jgi:protein required for attachment to host cells
MSPMRQGVSNLCSPFHLAREVAQREKEKKMTIWVLVADNSRARFFAAEKASGSLREVRDLLCPEARLREGDLVTDRSGSDRNPGIGTHGFGADASHKEDEADRFALDVCGLLESARTGGAFRKLYVVAAPHFLGLLRKHQSSSLRQMVAGEVDKNLATQDRALIRKHLPEYL